MFKVLKKDGSTQDFDRNKIINGVVKCGASAEIAEAVAIDVEAAFAEKTDANTVSYLDIKAKVLESLGEKDPTCAESFASFK